MANLADDTAIEGSGGRYRARLSPDWEIWGPNGGYLGAIALRAAGAEARILRPVSFYCHFLSVARFEEVELTVTPVHLGKRAESIRVSMVQGGKPVLEGLLRTAVLADGLEHTAYEVPEVPPPLSLLTLEELGKPAQHAFWRNIEQRVIAPERLAEPRGALPPRWLEWYRFRPQATFDDPFVDAARPFVLIDTLSWPATWLRHPTPSHLAPSLDVMVFFHASAAHSPYLLVDQTSPVARDGLVAGTGCVYDEAGALVASGGAQLLCVPAGP
jgi:acyl-CoA thioesterase-2